MINDFYADLIFDFPDTLPFVGNNLVIVSVTEKLDGATITVNGVTCQRKTGKHVVSFTVSGSYDSLVHPFTDEDDVEEYIRDIVQRVGIEFDLRSVLMDSANTELCNADEIAAKF